MKKRYLVAGLSAVVVVIFLALAVWIFPLAHAAFLLRDVSKFQGFSYEISVNQKEENLSQQQKQAAYALAWMLGGGESLDMSFHITGRASEGLAYGEIYWEGCEKPITELYVRQEEGLMNVEMLYDAIRENLTAQSPFLGNIMPEWGYGEFLSSTQLEQIFQVDLAELFRAKGLKDTHSFSFWEGFRMLIGMKSRKGPDGGRQFETKVGDYQVVLEIKRDGAHPSMDVVVLDQTENKEGTSYTGRFVFQETERIVVPDSAMSDNEIQQLAKLWSGMSSLGSMFPRNDGL
ncbi:hypothetical protein C806_03533 [Lachnospiraceae bacterium 3-1]|nr:hypothetical protein C806_03533 [Lachnospiraceae bacterium 3-1]